VDATLRLAERALEGRGTEPLIYNIGNEDWTSVKEIADAVVDAMKLRGVRYVFVPGTPDGRGWPGDVKLMLLDITKLKRDLGWRPKYSSIEAVRLAAGALVKELLH